MDDKKPVKFVIPTIIIIVIIIGGWYASTRQKKEDMVTSISKDDLITVTAPLPNASVTSPLPISGEARGTWYFEASFPVKLYDANGKLLGSVAATTASDWMTENYIPFTALLTFKSPATATGTLVLEKDNPSGLPEHANEIIIPVTFSVATTTLINTAAPQNRTVKLYYYDASKDRDSKGVVLCSRQGLVAVERRIPATMTPLQDAVKLLIQGKLTPEEKSAGISTEYPLSGLVLMGATRNGTTTLTLAFSDPEHKTSGGVCRANVLWYQIEATAKQFPGMPEIKFAPKELFHP
ncbi:MAG: hypothetical protein UY07_C0030G0004 [Parcubacteria group bacterium GW2011_GWA1_47_8]|nr:MAG: hypothetical protein UW71_C0034G0002 [Parcubacteria group bacterium GW2011_GWB1_44_7]KKU80892.1 MAG: hypothetical protein UY07_C0030G0004 [Parcubacteria group bacterium GW2011_GWA1_47_8]